MKANTRKPIIRDTDRSAFITRMKKRASNMKDRKSTRLNSSHSSISYAVFCLKKKKKQKKVLELTLQIEPASIAGFDHSHTTIELVAHHTINTYVHYVRLCELAERALESTT